MNPTAIKTALAAEVAKRAIPATPTDVLAVCFAQQRAFIEDPCRLKSAFCTRRSAKSYTGGLYAYHVGQRRPNGKTLYIGLTRDSARLIFWNDVLKAAGRQLGLAVRFHETFLEATLTNGHTIKLLGMDTTEEEKEKALGQKYDLVIIDEAASFTIDLHDLVYRILKPAVMDNQGTICLLGTPGNLTQGLFYDVTNQTVDIDTGLPKVGGWSLHRWHTTDNPHTREQYLQDIEEIKRDNPLYMETSAFKQMYLGEWAVDEGSFVYKYTDARNRANMLPKAGWQYVLGVDLGYEDDSAFVVLAYSHQLPTLYVTEVYKRVHMDITDVANKITELDKRYNFDFKIIDGSNKQAVQELNNRHGHLGLVAADKTGKPDFIQIMNDEFIQRKILLLPAAEALGAEYRKLVWYIQKTKLKTTKIEHPILPNHACDAALYAWRYTYTYIQNVKAPKYKPGDTQYDDQQEQLHIDRIRAKQANAANGFPASHW